MFYVIIFSSFDIISLVIQAIGGAGAARAEEQGTSTASSTHILVSPRGTHLQLGSGYLCSSRGERRLLSSSRSTLVSHKAKLATAWRANTISENQIVSNVCCCNHHL